MADVVGMDRRDGVDQQRRPVTPTAVGDLVHHSLGAQRQRTLSLTLLVVAIAGTGLIGVGLIGGWRLDPVAARMAPDVPSPTAPTRSPSTSPELTSTPTDVPETAFRSERYAYSLEMGKIADTWRLFAAASSTWEGSRPSQHEETDRFSRIGESRPTLEIAAHPLQLGMSDQTFLATYVGVPTEAQRAIVSCAMAFGPLTESYVAPDGAWHLLPTVAHRTWVRAVCDRIDGVIIGGGLAHVVTLANRDLHLDAFERVLAALELDGGLVESDVHLKRYEYTVRVPAGWRVEPATTDWSADNDRSPTAVDAFVEELGGSGRTTTFSVAARTIRPGADLERWAAENVPPPLQYRSAAPHHHCVYGGMTMETVVPSWVADEIAGVRGYVRDLCGELDGVIIVGDRVFHFNLRTTARPARGNRAVFREWVERLTFDKRQTTIVDFKSARGAKSFVSQSYGYSISVPVDWRITPASATWTAEVAAAQDMDIFAGPAESGSPTLSIAARQKPIEISEDRFVADAAPLPDAVRLNGPAVYCDFGGTVLERGPIPPWETEVIGGHRARVRSMCGTVDAVVLVGDRGFVFSLRSGVTTRGDIDRFHELMASVRFADTFDLDGGQQTSEPMRSFSSDRYGYSIGYPLGWRAVPAVERWDGDGSWTDRMADRFIDPSGKERSFIVVSAPLAGGIVDEAWLARFVPRPKGTGGSYCVLTMESGGHIMPDATQAWTEAIVAGRPARARPLCGGAAGVQAVLTVGDRVYVLWLMVPFFSHSFGATDTFNQIADTFRIDP